MKIRYYAKVEKAIISMNNAAMSESLGIYFNIITAKMIPNGNTCLADTSGGLKEVAETKGFPGASGIPPGKSLDS